MKIHEIKNNKLIIEAVKMKNDAMIKHVEPPLPNYYGFFLIICGKPNSGKTTFLLNLINNKHKHTYYKKFDKIYILSNSLHTISTKIKLPDDRMFDGIGELEELIEGLKKEDEKVLLIIDDCVTDLKNADYMLKLIYNRRHIGGGISIIITTQVYNKINLAIRKAATDLVLFNTSNKRELQSVFDDFINVERSTYDDIIRFCFRHSAHDFMFLKTTDNTYYHNFNKLEFSD